MARKPVTRVPDEEPPACCCNECWFYEPLMIDHGACYGTPPTPIFDGEELSYPRSIVMFDDRGCAFFKPRHTA